MEITFFFSGKYLLMFNIFSISITAVLSLERQPEMVFNEMQKRQTTSQAYLLLIKIMLKSCVCKKMLQQ